MDELTVGDGTLDTEPINLAAVESVIAEEEGKYQKLTNSFSSQESEIIESSSDETEGNLTKLSVLSAPPMIQNENLGEEPQLILEEEPLESEIVSDSIHKTLNHAEECGKELAGTSTNMRLPFSFPGQSFSEQAQKLILNVWDFFKRAKKDPKLIHSLRGPQDHASAALNVGTKTIGKIAKRVLRFGKLETPGKKRNRPKTVLDSIKPDGEAVLRSIIKEMHAKRIAPTISLVLADAKEKLDFKGSTTSLRRILKRMGYKYGGNNNSLIHSNVSGWKEKATKKSWKLNQKKTERKPTKISQEHDLVSIQPTVTTTIGSDSEMIESHEIISAHEMLDAQEVIIHYQPKSNENEFLTHHHQDGTSQMIINTVSAPEIIQLQLENGETVVQEWQWQPLQKLDDCGDENILGVHSNL